MSDLPPLALSVRQPWAWAIVAGHKPVENRSKGSIRAGRMTRGWICIHASQGLKQEEFRWGHWRLGKHGVKCPHPTNLPRRAIVGVAEVVDIVDKHDSEWFGGHMGLALENARMIDPVPASGALGYFQWEASGTTAPTLPWMETFDPLTRQPSLFDDLPMSFETPPTRPSRK